MSQTIDPKKYFLVFAGITVVQYKKGTMITSSYDSKAFDDQVSADGFAVRIMSADMRGSIKFTLDQSSPSNDLLTRQAQLDRLTGAGKGPVLFRDLNGTSYDGAADAWIEKIPDGANGSESESREWVIRCGQLDHFVGGQF